MVFSDIFGACGGDFDGSKSILAVLSANLSVSAYFRYFSIDTYIINM